MSFENAISLLQSSAQGHAPEAPLERYMQQAIVPIACLDRDLRFLWVNDAYAAIGRRPVEAYVGRGHFELYPNAENEALFRRVLETGEPFQQAARPFHHPDQPERGLTYWDVGLQPVQDGQGRSAGLVLTLVDVTEREKALREASSRQSRIAHLKETLEQERARLKGFLHVTGIGTWEWNVQNGAVRFNDRWAEMIGYTLADLEPLSIETWTRHCHPEDQEASARALAAVFDGQTSYYQCDVRVRHKTGSWVWIQDNGVVIDWTEDGRPLLMVGTHLDITPYKSLEEELRRSNADLEQFAYAVSHDLRQPLRAINGFAELLEDALPDEMRDGPREMIHFIETGARQMDAMIRSLLAYSRLGRGGEPAAPHDMGLLAAQALRSFQANVDESKARVEMAGSWPVLPVRASEIVRLFQNLIGNALTYRDPARRPEIELRAIRCRTGWMVSVSDNGIGIAPDARERVFEVFQRLHTQEEYEGTGIGLALCRRIVKQHGGQIWIESDGEGRGTTVFFTLPDTAGGQGDETER
jgi:PAS domain S-box-containing protein